MIRRLLCGGGAVILGARGLVRPVVLAAVGVAGLVVVPAAAWASPPEQGTFSSHEVFVDSEVCAPEGFSVDVVQDEVQTFRVFFDRTGAFAFFAVHVDYRAVISANGHTIVERDKWKDTFYSDGRRGPSETRCTSRGRARVWSNTMRARSCSGPTDLSKRSTVRTLSLRARRSASLCCRSRKGAQH